MPLHAEVMIDQAKTATPMRRSRSARCTTRHSAYGRWQDTVPYTATAGTLTIRDARQAEREHLLRRLHRGRRAKLAAAGDVLLQWRPGLGVAVAAHGLVRADAGADRQPRDLRPAPFGFGANPDTLLDKTDMVFLDAPGTGYSRPLGDAKGSDFYGVDQDTDAFAKAIMRYVTKFDRWNSPKFLFGESYGTTRSGALAYQLQDRGMALNGVVLLSSIMNYGRRAAGP